MWEGGLRQPEELLGTVVTPRPSTAVASWHVPPPPTLPEGTKGH